MKDWIGYETQVREHIHEMTTKSLSFYHSYSVNFLREFKDRIDFKQLFQNWYHDAVINPNVIFREWDSIPIEDFLEAQFPHYKEFWKPLI